MDSTALRNSYICVTRVTIWSCELCGVLSLAVARSLEDPKRVTDDGYTYASWLSDMSSVDELWADLQAQESRFNASHALRVKKKHQHEKMKTKKKKKREELQDCDGSEPIVLSAAAFFPCSADELLKDWSRNICRM